LSELGFMRLFDFWDSVLCYNFKFFICQSMEF
jgi:hypothetical protein